MIWIGGMNHTRRQRNRVKLLHADSLRRRGVEKFKNISLTAVVTFNELLDAEPTAPALDIE